jgi:hypothetical protein
LGAVLDCLAGVLAWCTAAGGSDLGRLPAGLVRVRCGRGQRRRPGQARAQRHAARRRVREPGEVRVRRAVPRAARGRGADPERVCGAARGGQCGRAFPRARRHQARQTLRQELQRPGEWQPRAATPTNDNRRKEGLSTKAGRLSGCHVYAFVDHAGPPVGALGRCSARTHRCSRSGKSSCSS